MFWTCYSGVVLSGVVFSIDGTTFVFSGIDVLFCVSVLFLIFSLICFIIALGVGNGPVIVPDYMQQRSTAP